MAGIERHAVGDLYRSARNAAAERFRAAAVRQAADPDILRRLTKRPAHLTKAPAGRLTGLRELAAMRRSAHAFAAGVAIPTFALLQNHETAGDANFERDYPASLMRAARSYARALDCDVTFEGVEAVEAAARDNLIGIFFYHTSLLPDCLLPWIHPTLARHFRIWADDANFRTNPFIQRIGLGRLLDNIHQPFIVRDGSSAATEATRLVEQVRDHNIWPCISPHAGRLQRRYDFDGNPIAPGFYTAVQSQPAQYFAALPGLAFAQLIQTAAKPMAFFVLVPEGAGQVMPKRLGNPPGLFMEPARVGRSIRFVFKQVFVMDSAPDTNRRVATGMAREINAQVERVMAETLGIDDALANRFSEALEREEIRARLPHQLRGGAGGQFAAATARGAKTHLIIFDRILAIPPDADPIFDGVMGASHSLLTAITSTTNTARWTACKDAVTALIDGGRSALVPSHPGRELRTQFTVELARLLAADDTAGLAELLRRVTEAKPKY